MFFEHFDEIRFSITYVFLKIRSYVYSKLPIAVSGLHVREYFYGNMKKIGNNCVENFEY